MSDIKMTNIPSMNVGKMVEKTIKCLLHDYSKQLSYQNDAVRDAVGTSGCR